MSFLKFSPDLFLEKLELERFTKFLVSEGYRLHLLQNTYSFGIIETKDDVSFNNFKVELGGNTRTIKIANKSFALDNTGLMITKEVEDNIELPADGIYWIKISHKFDSKEEGEVTIDANGNLVGVATRFTEVLRGQPNFPAKIKFIGSTLNILEYPVVEVIDNENAVLTGVFQAETDLEYKIIGTFTPDAVPAAANKEPFQYDSANLEFILETVSNTAPTKTPGQEFYIARIEIVGNDVTIEDKRTEFWKTKADFQHSFIEKLSNPLIGVEVVKFSNQFTPKDKNQIEIAWGFRSSDHQRNSSLRKITLNSGLGGKFKTTADFTTGDFDGWRLYAKDGSYKIIVSSIEATNAIDLTLQSLDPDDYTTGDELLVVPDVEEVTILTIPDAAKKKDKVTVDVVDDSSTYTDTINGFAIQFTSDASATKEEIAIGLKDAINADGNVNTDVVAAHTGGEEFYTVEAIVGGVNFTHVVESRLTIQTITPGAVEHVRSEYIFPINQGIAKLDLLVPSEATYKYNIHWRYKKFGEYSPYETLPEDTIGYYDESSFDLEGVINDDPGDRNRKAYSGEDIAKIELVPNTNNFFNFKERVDLGDLPGVRDTSGDSIPGILLDNGLDPAEYKLVVGLNRQHQIITVRTGSETFTKPHVISLEISDSEDQVLKDGVIFYLYFRIPTVVLSGNLLEIRQDIDGTDDLLYSVTQNDIAFTATPSKDFLVKCYYDKDNESWQIFLPNETLSSLGGTPLGGIIMYSGVVDDTVFEQSGGTAGLGKDGSKMEGWALCNGNNGTSNLVDKFIRSADAAASNIGATDGVDTQTDIPEHNHGITDPGHRHTVNTTDVDIAGTSHLIRSEPGAALVTDPLINSVTGITINNEGEAAGVDNRPAFFTLAYIQRIT